MKEITDSLDLINPEDLNEIKEVKRNVYGNDIKLALIFSKCLNLIYLNASLIRNETKDFSIKLSQIAQIYDIQELRRITYSYGDGEDYGDYIFQERIRDIVENNRNKIVELINIFTKIFGDEL